MYTLLKEYGISARLTFSNSLLREEHLSDRKCNRLCSLFEDSQNGIIIYSDLLMEYIKNYPKFYYVSSTTKVITDFDEFKMKPTEKSSDMLYLISGLIRDLTD